MSRAQDKLLQELAKYIAELALTRLQEELDVSDKLLKEYERVMKAIPACPLHGHHCVPHALRWIEAQKTISLEDAIRKVEMGNPSLEELNEWLLGR